MVNVYDIWKMAMPWNDRAKKYGKLTGKEKVSTIRYLVGWVSMTPNATFPKPSGTEVFRFYPDHSTEYKKTKVGWNCCVLVLTQTGWKYLLAGFSREDKFDHVYNNHDGRLWTAGSSGWFNANWGGPVDGFNQIVAYMVSSDGKWVTNGIEIVYPEQQGEVVIPITEVVSQTHRLEIVVDGNISAAFESAAEIKRTT